MVGGSHGPGTQRPWMRHYYRAPYAPPPPSPGPPCRAPPPFPPPPCLTWGAMLVSGNRELSCARNSLLATQGTSSDAGASNEEA